jgi:hypothetical protein
VQKRHKRAELKRNAMSTAHPLDEMQPTHRLDGQVGFEDSYEYAAIGTLSEARANVSGVRILTGKTAKEEPCDSNHSSRCTPT